MQIAPVHDHMRILEALASLERTYPGFRDWYRFRVMPGVPSGQRLVLAAVEDGRILALSILKRSVSQRKLCTLWKSEASRGDRTLEKSLLAASTGWLGTDRPGFTVPEDMLPRLHGLAATLSARNETVLGPLYREGVREFAFNGSGL